MLIIPADLTPAEMVDNIATGWQYDERFLHPLSSLTHDRHRGRVLLWTLMGLVLGSCIAFVVLLTVPAPIELWLQARVLLALLSTTRAMLS